MGSSRNNLGELGNERDIRRNTISTFVCKDEVVKETQSKNNLPTSLERARLAARLIVDNKGEDVRILDLREITQAFDFFVIGSGTSRRQLPSISDEIDDVFEKEMGDKRRSVAGYQESRWVVLDYGDVVVHLFEPETREFYALEDLWGKGKEVDLDDHSSDGETRKAVPVVETETEHLKERKSSNTEEEKGTL